MGQRISLSSTYIARCFHAELDGGSQTLNNSQVLALLRKIARRLHQPLDSVEHIKNAASDVRYTLDGVRAIVVELWPRDLSDSMMGDTDNLIDATANSKGCARSPWTIPAWQPLPDANVDGMALWRALPHQLVARILHESLFGVPLSGYLTVRVERLAGACSLFAIVIRQYPELFSGIALSLWCWQCYVREQRDCLRLYQEDRVDFAHEAIKRIIAYTSSTDEPLNSNYVWARYD